MAEAAAARGRLKNLATQMPGIGQGAYDQRMRQYGQLGGVGEAYRDREQSAINLAQEKFLQEQAFPEEQLGRYLRFITNAPSPSGFSRTVTAPGVRGPSTIAQLGGLAGGLGTLAGGLGGTGGLFSRGGAVLPASGRRAGLSGVVRRASGGQIVRMQDGGPPPIDFRSRMPNRKTLGAKFLQNLLDVEGIAETRVDDIQKSFNTAPGVPTVREQGDFLYPNKGLGSGIDPYMELVAGLDSEQIEKMTPSKPKVEETVVEKDTTPAPEAPEKEQSLAERYAAYRKLMEGDEEETGLSWPERLQIASALFGATDTPSTGSFLGDLSQFGAQVSPGVAKGLAARDARELAAKKRRIQSVKDFRDFVREEKLDAREADKLAADLNLKGAQAEESRAKAAKERGAFLEYPDKPAIALIQEAEQVLDNIGGYKYNETKFDKQRITKPGTLGYDIAVLSQMLKKSPRDLIPILENTPDAIITDNKGRSSLNRDMFFGGGRKVIQSKAEGGRVDDRPILRYPEDF
jgi:hypothetical protein